MKKSSTFFRGLISVLFLAAILLSITGCQEPETITGSSPFTEFTSPKGTYTSTYGETYVITDTSFSYSSEMDWEGVTYTTTIIGTDLAIVYLTETAGILYYKVTGVDKWAATAYKNVTSAGAALSNAYKAAEAGGKEYCDTLQEAKTEFTIDNGYFAYFGQYAKE